jgi:uncharacterized caspase-like protein
MKRRFMLLLVFLGLIVIYSFAQKGNIYVVSVGISNYQNISDLTLPEKDAKAIAELYKTQTKNVILITGKYATKARVLKSLEDQFSRAKEQDMIVFAFSGHGYPGGLCPYDMSAKDGSGLSYREIRGILKQSRAKRKMIFADACFSGGIRSNVSNNHQVHQNSEVLLFLSSRGGETSIESPFMINGVFTTYLLRGLRGGADTDRNRKITAKELFQFVSQGVKERSKDKQHPVMWGKFNDNEVLMDWNK